MYCSDPLAETFHFSVPCSAYFKPPFVRQQTESCYGFAFSWRLAYLNAFDPNQRQALTSLSLALHESGLGIGLTVFGVSCLIVDI
jgi:hypothetical protein